MPNAAGSSERHPRVYIIILTWNKKEVTVNCLQNLRQLRYPNYRVVIVDNDSQDGTVETVGELFPEMEILVNSRNLGFSGGSNVGIRHALEQGADYVFLLNNDTLFPNELLDVLVSTAQAHPETGMVVPKIIHSGADGGLWFAGSRSHWLTLDTADFSPYGARHDPGDQTQKVDYIFGTALMVKKAVFEKIGLLDEAFYLYYEDMDLSLRARQAGFDLLMVPSVRVEHHISASTEGSANIRYYHKGRSSVLFYKKYTRGLRWVVILPYRVISALLTVGRLMRQKQSEAIQPFLRGLIDGLTGSLSVVP